MKALVPLAVILGIAGLAYAGGRSQDTHVLLGVVLPYAAMGIFLIGFSYRVVRWAWSAVPFHIPTTCGQQKTLSWIRPSAIENPSGKGGVAARMAFEILLFRSLFRNNQPRLQQEGPRLLYTESKWLWLGALAFHWALLIVLLRHLRYFLNPVPAFLLHLDGVDGFLQIGAPQVFVTDAVILAALLYLLVRRFTNRRVRYISLYADYFALFLLLGIVLTGILMRYYYKVDLEVVKQLALGLVTFSPLVPAGLAPLFFVHLALVSLLLAYFPFSKLMHMGGIFLTPTRNLANDSRVRRHVNPWDYPVKVHTYEEWEAEFHDKIASAGLPLEKE